MHVDFNTNSGGSSPITAGPPNAGRSLRFADEHEEVPPSNGSFLQRALYQYAQHRLDLIDEYKFLVHPGIAGHGPTLYQSGLPSTRRLELVSAKPLRSGAVAMHYRRAR